MAEVTESPLDADKGAREMRTDMEADKEAAVMARRQRRGGGRRSLSFSNVRDIIRAPVVDMPASPELCGVQAILPKKSGLSVSAKIGEGTFGKVVLATQKKKHAGIGQSQLGKAARILHAMPKEGVEVVLKCIKKPGGTVSAEMVREVRVHGRCDHVNIPRMFGYFEDHENLMLILDLVPVCARESVRVRVRACTRACMHMSACMHACMRVYVCAF